METSRASRCFAGIRVFDDERILDAQKGCSQQVWVRSRLAPFDAFSGDQNFKELADVGLLEDRFDFSPAGGGDNGEFEGAERGHQVPCGRRDRRIGEGLLAEERLFSGVVQPEVFDVVRGRLLPAKDFEHVAICDAYAVGAVGFPTQWDAERREDFSPTIEVDAFAVGQHAVEVEQDRVKWGQLERLTRKQTERPDLAAGRSYALRRGTAYDCAMPSRASRSECSKLCRASIKTAAFTG